MAFDENLTVVSSSLSRLSICTSSSVYDGDEANILTSEIFHGGTEADGEVSDDGRGKENVQKYDSDEETPKFYSLPATPSRRRKKLQLSDEFKSDDQRRQRKVNKEKKKKGINGRRHGFNGESDGGRREGLTVLTRAKGGEKSLRMGLEEVKACRDLGFELEVPGRVSVSTGSNFDTQTSSGSNSPINTWRISSPGDDPREVKARLKVWAQAVALASSSRQP